MRRNCGAELSLGDVAFGLAIALGAECEFGPDLVHWAEQPAAMNDPKRQMTQPTAGRLEIHEYLVVHAEPINREQTDTHFRKILRPRLTHMQYSAALGSSAQRDWNIELVSRRAALVEEAGIAHAQLLDQTLDPDRVIVLDCERILSHVNVPRADPGSRPKRTGGSRFRIRFRTA